MMGWGQIKGAVDKELYRLLVRDDILYATFFVKTREKREKSEKHTPN